MTLLHAVTGMGLIVFCILSVVTVMKPDTGTSVDERLSVFGMCTALALGVVLFTGFIQIGSVNTVQNYLLYKFGFTVFGGVLALFSTFAYNRSVIGRIIYFGLQIVAIGLFCTALYLALTH